METRAKSPSLLALHSRINRQEILRSLSSIKTHLQIHNHRNRRMTRLQSMGLLRCTASNSDSASYAEQLEACEASGDWLKAVELLAEVRALNVELPGEAFEPAVRLCSQSGQWQKAVSILEQAQAQGNVSGPTAVAVFTTLLREGQPKAALQLLKEMNPRWTDSDSELTSRCHNLVARACARGGMLDEGLELLDHMYKAEVNINRDTYEALALACLRAGRGDRAEELFEERDYL